VQVGDYVHNVPYNQYGVIIEEISSGTGDPNREEVSQPERWFLVLYDCGTINAAGSGFLDKMMESV